MIFGIAEALTNTNRRGWLTLIFRTAKLAQRPTVSQLVTEEALN